MGNDSNQTRRMLFVDRDRGPVAVTLPSDVDAAFVTVDSRGDVIKETPADADEVASFIGRHHHAIRARLRGRKKALRPFENTEVDIGGEIYVAETDPQVLVSLYYSDDLDYQDPYDTSFLDHGDGDVSE
jgi:hypothetical protein